jgi:hypothetical protein
MTLFPPRARGRSARGHRGGSSILVPSARAGALLEQKISSQVSMAFPPRAGRERHGAEARSQPRGAHE